MEKCTIDMAFSSKKHMLVSFYLPLPFSSFLFLTCFLGVYFELSVTFCVKPVFGLRIVNLGTTSVPNLTTTGVPEPTGIHEQAN